MARCVLIVTFHPKPGAWDEVNAIIVEHARLTLAEEPGCHQFDVLHPEAADGGKDSGRIMLMEVYEDREALAAHRRNPRMPAIGAALDSLLAGRDLVTCDLA